MARWMIAAALSVLGGCTTIPALEGTIGPDLAARDYPALIPLDGVLAPGTDRTDPAALADGLAARRAALEARAATLRAPVVTSQDRARMEAGIRP